MNNYSFSLKNMTAAVLLLVFSCAYMNMSAQSLLDGKKWTTAKNVSGSSGTMQGAAYYNGKIYQFTDKCAQYGIYDIANNTWSAGSALNTGVLASCHFGSAAFGPESTKTYTVGGVQHTSAYPLLFVTGHDKTSTPKAIVIYVIDLELGQAVTQLRFEHTDNRDDKIAAYDFDGGKIYIFGYPEKVMEGHSPYTVWTYSDVNFNTFASESVTMSPNLTAETNVHAGIGGPNAEGIQENLACGTLQDCHYHNGYIYYATSRGSEYNRTEFAKVHALNVSTWQVEKALVCNNATEPEGFAFDGTNFYMTCGGAKLWKLSAGSGYDANNYEPATLIAGGEYDGYYKITNASQFVWFKSMVYNGCTTMKAYLANDIDMTGQTDPFTYYIYDNAIQTGTSIPKFEAQFAFRGTFDGNGHTITNVNITSTPYYNDGLFPYVKGGTIKNVTVKGNITLSKCRQLVYDEAQSKNVIKTDQPVANVGLIGYMDGGILENVNAFITIDETVAGVSGTINKLIGTEGAAVTRTNCRTEETHVNGFKISGTSADADYYEQPSLVDGWYEIDNAGKLFWFANQVNAGNATYNAKLTKDIDMDGTNHSDFPGIGYYVSTAGGDRKPFSGNFDGQGHRIYNCNITTNNSSYWGSGLIGYAYATSSPKKEIKDFTLEGKVTAKCGARAGGVLGYVADGYSISGITSSVEIESTTLKTGGLAGFISTSTVSKCRFNGTITNSNNWTGGLFAEVLRSCTISDCLFDGTVNSTRDNADVATGGIAAIIGGASANTVSNCLSYGTITTKKTGTNTGKVFGRVDGALTLSNVYYGAQGTSTPTIDYNANGKTITGSVTTITTQTWDEIKTALNNGSTNWGIGSKKEYPIPGEVDATQYTVTFNTNGGSECASVTKVANSVITLPTTTKDGFVFAGWTVAADGTGTKYAGGASYTITANVTLYAQWVEAFTITFNTNGGSACASVTKVANSVITLPTSEKAGYVFAGWNTAEDGTGTSYAAGASYTITATVTLYAQWKEAYTITFESNGGSACASVTNVAGTEITLPTPTRDDYIFNGWNTAEDGSGTSYNGGASYTITASATLYAQWTADETGDYRNGFHKTHVKTADDYYQEPALLTADKCTEIGIATTYAGYYQVKNAGNMFWIAKKLSADNNTRKYVVTADIDMAGNDANHKDWPGIGAWGSTDTHFKGTFDGLGHKFTNYYMSITGSNSWKAMFSVPNGATIKNFSVSGSIDISSTGSQFGTVGGRIAGTTTIEDIHSSVNITVATGKTPASIGGIVGQCSAQTSFNRCRYSGTITGNSAYKNLGGIFGNAEGILTINNCLFDGTITSTSTKIGSGDDAIQIAGVGGRNNNKTTITNCLMIGTITVPSNSEAVDAEKTHSGIIFGYQKTTADLTITNTYYSTSKCTSGIRAVGLNEATNQSKADPTEITTQTWDDIKDALNGRSNPANWGINSQVYPVPGEVDGVKRYVITFNTNGGTEIAPIRQEAGTPVTAPANPTKTGYTFNYWMDASGNETTVPAIMPEYDLTLTAKWTINQYTITFNLNGAPSAAIAAITQDYGTSITKPADPTWAEHTFTGWEPAIPSTMPAENMTCTAHWVKETFTNGFNDNFDSCSENQKYQKALLENGYYLIDNGGKLFWFANYVNNTDKSAKAKLTADINLENHSFNNYVIGTYNAEYKGIFDGQGHTISGFNLTKLNNYVGLFGAVMGTTSQQAEVKNFTLKGTMSTEGITASQNWQSYGSIAGRLRGYATMEDVHSEVTIDYYGKTKISGGIIGTQEGTNNTVNRCSYTGTMTISNPDENRNTKLFGGIVGELAANNKITNCLFGGTIKVSDITKIPRIGGIAGNTKSGNTIKNCLVAGTIEYTGEPSGEYVPGGIVGTAEYAITISDCYYKKASNLNIIGNNVGGSSASTSGSITEAELVDGRSYFLITNNNGQWSQTLGYQTGKTPANYSPVPKALNATDCYKITRTQNDQDNTKYDYTVGYYYFDDMGDATVWPSDAASIKAKKIGYSRSGTYMTQGFISVCMPFALNADKLPGGENCKVKVFDQVKEKDGANYVYFKDATKENDAYAAGVPYFLYLPDVEDGPRGKEWTVTLTNEAGIDLVMEVSNPDDNTRGIYGSFTTIKTGAWSNEVPMYKIKSDGVTLVKTTDSSNCYPYRGYLKLPSSSNAGDYRLSFDGCEEGNENSLESTFEENADAEARYNLQGQPVDANAKGMIIMGGKIRLVK